MRQLLDVVASLLGVRREGRVTRSGDRCAAGRRRVLRFEALEDKTVLATFAVIGDYGSAGAGELAVADLVKSWNPDAVLTLGDNNYEDGAAATIDANIGQYYHDYIGNYQGAYGAGSPTNRFFPSLGNHDWETAGAKPYLDYFTLPGNERYYDFVLDNVHFFAIDSDEREPDGNSSTSAQGTWLRNGLANSQQLFNVVYFHHAPYTSDQYVGATSVMRWPFKDWGADAVISGHAHQYERLNVGGLPFFVNGLGGAEILPFGATVAGSQVRYNDDFGAMRIVTGPASLKFEFISVDGGTLIDSYTLAAGGVVNDNLAGAATLAGTSVAAAGTNVGATFEAGEPYNVGTTGGKSVWWNWTAPAAGAVTLSTAGSSFDTTLGVYTGTAINLLTRVASNDDETASLLTSKLNFTAVAGETYRISVDGYGGASGAISLQLTAAASTGNDSFAARRTLAGGNARDSASNVAATLEAGEPKNGGVTGGKSLWWTWTAPSAGPVTISTAGSSFDTTLGVYTGSSVNGLTAVAGNDDESGSIRTSRVSFTAVAGRIYQISVDGYKGASGNIELALVANDNFANRAPLGGANVTVAGANVAASLETGEPKNAGVAGGKSVWWSWTAPAAGTVVISTNGSSFDTTLGAYTGTSVGALTAVAVNDDETSSLRTSRIQFNAVAGMTYQISVDGYKAAVGNIALSLVLAPANDNFANRAILSGANVTASGSNVNATREANEPLLPAADGRTVWWTWTAPATGTVTVSTAGSDFDTSLGVYSGTSVNALTGIAANDDESPSLRTSLVRFAVVAGRQYQIAVDGRNAAAGNVSLRIFY